VDQNLIFKGKYNAKIEFLEQQGEERVQIKIPSMGGVWLFLEQHIAICMLHCKNVSGLLGTNMFWLLD